MPAINDDGAANKVDLTIIHFNDVYDVESQKKEPIGGAARFCTAVKKYSQLNPVVLFSGDCFAPSLLSQFTKGEQMIPVLNHCQTACAVYGNHDFDFGVEILAQWVQKTNFPWLMSNVIDNETSKPLGDGHITQILELHGKKIGLMGLVEWEWLETLSTIDPEAVTYTDYVDVGNELAASLKKQGCDLIVALTHMRFPNDIRLAEKTKGIDLILGGHDHVYDVKHINGIPVLKSGTDFRDMSAIGVTFDKNNKPKFNIERISITSDYEEDPLLKAELDVYTNTMSSKLDDVLGEFQTDLDGRFETVRTSESNLGNFVCDVMLATTNADLGIINSGTLRSDRIHPAGPFTLRDMMTVLPMMDMVVLLNVSGTQIIEALENGVSQYPKLEGRFPQVAGLRFAFDPSKSPGNRVDPKFVKIGDEYLLPHQFYKLVTKEYIGTGHDGYTVLANAEVLADSDQCLELSIAIQNHFHAVEIVTRHANQKHSRHHQSLITLSRRHSLLRSMTSAHDMNHSSPSLERCSSLSPRPSLSRQGNIVDEMEKKACKLAPAVEGRIINITSKEVLHELMNERKEWEATRAIQEEDENVSPTTPTALSRLHALYNAAIAAESNHTHSASDNNSQPNSRDISSPHK